MNPREGFGEEFIRTDCEFACVAGPAFLRIHAPLVFFNEFTPPKHQMKPKQLLASRFRVSFAAATAACHFTGSAQASIISVEETGRGADKAAVIAAGFGEDALAFSDRTHQHNGASFAEATGLPSATGTVIVPLPDYLVGGDYVAFANDARDNAGYSAVVTTDTPSTFYLLVDNRANGPAGAFSSPNNTDPVLGGTLQWVIDGGWERVDTGISPGGQGDYTGVDGDGNGIGAGIEIQDFYSVYKFPAIVTAITVKNPGFGGGNMISLIAVPTAPPPDPILSFTSSSATILPGGSTNLLWQISPTASSATISSGVGNVLPITDGLGAGTAPVTPAVNTTYTLSVNTPTGNDTRQVAVTVQPLASFTGSPQRIDAGESVTFSWQVRPDAAVTFDGENVAGRTNAQGVGSITVQPEATRDYVFEADAEGITNTATGGVMVRPAGPSFALVDIGATGGRVEPGSAGGKTIGGAAVGVNLTDLLTVPILSDTGVEFTLAMNSLDPAGTVVGGLDWRDRGDAPSLPLNRLGEDFVKNNTGMIHVTLGDLPAGTYDVESWHTDSDNSQCEAIRILVTDANGTAVDTTVAGSALWSGGFPGVAGLTTGKINAQLAKFQVKSNGTDSVQIFFDGTAAADKEVPLAGLRLTGTGPRPVDTETWALIDLGGLGDQVEPGSAGGAVVGLAANTNGTNLGATDLTSRDSKPFQIALDNLDPTGNPVGGLDWRDRGVAPSVPLTFLSKDFVKNNLGMIHMTLAGLPAGEWRIQSYHMDPTLSQADNIRTFVTDASRTAMETTLTGSAAFDTGDGGAPQLNGLWPGLVEQRSLTLPVTSNGTDPVELWYDGTQGADLEVPLGGVRILGSLGVSESIAVTNVTRTVTGGTASVAVTFVSEAGKTYTAYASDNPANWGAPLTATLAATGTSTVFMENNIPLTSGRRFYQIRRN